MAALAAAAAGCSLKAPATPHWSVTLRVPLTEKSVSVADLASHNPTYLQIDSTGTAGFHWARDLAEVTVGNSLRLPSIASSSQALLGVFQVNPAPPQDIQVQLSEIWPQAAGVGGQLAQVPAIQFAPVQAVQSQGFESAQVSSGTLQVRLRNGLPIALDESTLELANTGTGASLGVLRFPGLAPGESASVSLALDGRAVSAAWSGTWHGSSPGSPVPVIINPSASVHACFSFQGPLTVSSAVAPLPAQSVAWSSVAALPDTEQLQSAEFTAGSLDLSFDNHWGVGGSLRLVLPDFTGVDGAPLARTVALDAARTVTASFPLAGARFTAADPSSPAVRLQGELHSDGTGTRNVALSSADRLDIQATLQGAALNRVTGRFAPFRVDFEPVTRQLDLPDGLGPLGLADAGATISLRSTADVPARVTLQVTGTDAGGRTWALTGPAGGALQVDVPGAPASGTGVGVLSLSGANSNLPEFLGHLPRTLVVNGWADAGDPARTSSVRATDTFRGHFEVSSALLASFSESVVDIGTDSIHISRDTRDRIHERLTRVRLHAVVENGLPLGAGTTLYLAASRAEVGAPTASTVALTATVAAAPTDPVTGTVTAANTQEVLLELTGSQVDVLQHDPVFLGGVVHLPGTAGRKVRVRAVDAVRSRMWLEAEAKVVR
jgi:hypothetical protein